MGLQDYMQYYGKSKYGSLLNDDGGINQERADYDLKTQQLFNPSGAEKAYAPLGQDVENSPYRDSSLQVMSPAERRERDARNLRKLNAPYAGTMSRQREAYDLEQRQKEYEDMLDAYYEEMNKEIDMDDPYTQRLLQLSGGAAMKQAKRQGVQGGLSVANSQHYMNQALTGHAMDRKRMGLQALGMKGGHLAGLAQLAQQEEEMRQRRMMHEQEMRAQPGTAERLFSASAQVLGTGLGVAFPYLLPATAAATAATAAAKAGKAGTTSTAQQPLNSSYGNSSYMGPPRPPADPNLMGPPRGGGY